MLPKSQASEHREPAHRRSPPQHPESHPASTPTRYHYPHPCSAHTAILRPDTSHNGPPPAAHGTITTMTSYQTWYEAQRDHELAITFAKLACAYQHRGKAARAAFPARLEAAIPSPDTTTSAGQQHEPPASATA